MNRPSFFPRFSGLATKIFGLVGVLSAIFLLVLFFFNDQIARDNARKLESDRLTTLQQAYLNDLEFLAGEVSALAVILADRDDIGVLYAAGDREAMYARLAPLFQTLRSRYRVVHFYITNPEGTIFLRVHQPERFGDSVTYRLTTLEAISQRVVTAGLELGVNRMGMRAVAPVVNNGTLQYLIEIGVDYDQGFVDLLKRQNQAEYTLWLTFDAAAPATMRPKEGVPAAPIGELFFYASSQTNYLAGFPAEAYSQVLSTGQPQIVTNADFGVPGAQTAMLLPMVDYKQNVIGVVEIAIPRAPLAGVLQASVYGNLLVAVLLVMIVVLLWAFQRIVLRPIHHITSVAQRYATGDLSAQVTVLPHDELGYLGQSLNMLANRLDNQLRNQQAVINRRTNEMTLAADIGRLLSEQENLEDQLNRAVNLIRERFDLYYVQVFLADTTRQVLIMRAGSGEVGFQFQARGLRLPIGAGSINGTAAARRETVLVTDTTQSLTFRTNPLLPETRSEMALPLIARNEVIGVLDLQSAHLGGLNTDNQTVFEVLAGQVAVAIENNLLLAQSRVATQTLAEQAARFTREGWQNQLDAIRQPRQLGYTFAEDTWQETPAPVIDPDQPHTLHVPLSLGEVDLGVILVEGEPGHRWTDDDRLLLAQISQQVVQHLENLRLLAEAEQARLIAEQASRRLVREAWQTHLSAQPTATQAFVFDQIRAQPVEAPAQLLAPQDEALSAPLLVRNEAIGDLALLGAPNPLEAQTLLGAVSERLSAHIENLRLLAETEQSRARAASYATRLQDLQDILRALSREVEPGVEAFHTAMVSMAGLLQAKFAALALLNEEGQSEAFIHYGMDEATVRRVGDMPKGRGLLGALLHEGKPLRIRDISADARAVGFPEHHPHMRSFLGVPLVFQENTLGRLYFTESLLGEFTLDDEALATSFAASFAGTIQSARLLRRIRTRAQEMETVAAIGTATATILNPQDLLQTVVDLVKANFGLYHAHIYLLTESGDALILSAGAGEMGRRMTIEGRTIPLAQEHSLVARAARTRQPVVVNDVLQDSGFLPNPYLPDTRAEMAVPILSGDRVLGVLDVQADKVNRFTSEDINIETVLANQVGGALQNARAFAAAEAAKQSVNALYEASASFNLVTSYDELLDALAANSVLGRAEQRLELLLLNDDTTATREAYWSATGETLPREQELSASPAMRQALEARQAVVIPEATATVLAVPLSPSGTNTGVALGWFDPHTSITKDDLRHLNGISGQAAVVTQNLRNIELIRQRAEDLARLTRAQQTLSQATDEAQLVAGLARTASGFGEPVVSLAYYDMDEAGQVATVDVRAVFAFGSLLPDEMLAALRHLPASNFPITQLILDHPNEVIEIADQQTDPRLNDAMRQQAVDQQWRAAIYMPLRTAGRWHGVVTFTWAEPRHFSPHERTFFRELLEPLAATLAARRAYVAEEAARRANEKRVAELNLLARVESQLSSAVTEAEMVLAFAPLLAEPPFPLMLALYYLETDANDWPVAVVTQALWQRGALVHQSPTLGQRFPLDDSVRQLWVKRPNTYTHIPNVLTDLRLSPAMHTWAKTAGFTSMCILSLRVGARWQGLLLIYWEAPHNLTESEHFLLGQVVEPLAANVASRRAYVQEQRTLRDVETLYRLSVQLSQAQSFQEMLHQCLEPVQADGAALFSFEAASDTITLTAAYNQRGAVLLPEGTRLDVRPLDLNPAWSADTEAPYLVADASQTTLSEAASTTLNAVQASRAALLPITAGGQLTGFIVLRWPTPAPFEERDEIFYRALTTRLSLAVENRTLLLQTQKRASELAAIAQMSVAVTTLLDVRELLQTVADLTQQNFDLYHAEVYQLNPHTSQLELVAASGELGRRALAAGPWSLPLESPAPAARAAQTRQGLFVNDLRQLGGVPQHPLLEDVRAELAQPLVVGNTLLGVLAIKSRRVGRFSQGDLTIKATLAAQVAVAVQNARLYEQARKRAERERQAFEIGQKIQATNSVEAALQTAIRELGQAYHANHTEIRLNK